MLLPSVQIKKNSRRQLKRVAPSEKKPAKEFQAEPDGPAWEITLSEKNAAAFEEILEIRGTVFLVEDEMHILWDND